MKNLRFYRGSYILTIGEPVVIVHVRANPETTRYVGELFVLYPKIKDRSLEYQLQPISLKIHPESVEMGLRPLQKKEARAIAFQRAEELIEQVKGHVLDTLKAKDAQLLARTTFVECKPTILRELWIKSFDAGKLKEIRDRSTSTELKSYLLRVFQIPRATFEDPYNSSENL